MKSFYRVYQTDAEVLIRDHNTESDYDYPYFLKLHDEEFATIPAAEADLKLYLAQHPDDTGEYTILKIFSN